MKKILIFTFLLISSFAGAQDWTASKASGRIASVTNATAFLGKGAGTIQAPLQLDASLPLDTATWKFVIVGSENRMLTNKVTFLGKAAGTVFAVLVYNANQLDTSKIARIDQNETISGNWNYTGEQQYKLLKSTPLVITNDTVFTNLGSVFTKTLSANTTFKISGLSDSQIITVAVTNTASNYTVTWSALGGLTLVWPGGSTPTQTTGAKTDIYSFQRIGNNIYAAAIQNF